jgi:uncharacterized membrane protein YdcZ (DUF606 family)
MTGISIIFQAGFNRQLASHVDLLTTVLINAVVFLIVSYVVWFIVRKNWIQVPESLQVKELNSFPLWYLVPGLFGIIIVFCMPLALQSLPAATAFGVSIATQLIMSVIWDFLTLGVWPTIQKVAGILLLFLGSMLMLT